jgi:cation diffusion facilitator family transporter
VGHVHGSAGTGPERLRSIRAAMAVAIVLFVAKLAVFLATGLISVLAEALHSLTDALQTGFLWVAAKLSSAPPDDAHPFGHGRGENLAAILVAMVVVTVVAVELIRHAVEALQRPPVVPEQPVLALVVLGASAVVMLWPLFLARQDMHAHGGVVRAQAVESLNDLLGVLAAFVGVGAVMLGVPYADPVAALVVAVIIVANAIHLVRINLPFLVGGSPPQAFYEDVRRVAQQEPGVEGVHSMAGEYIGPTQVHLDLSLTVPASLTIDEADELAHRVRHRLARELHLTSLAIHFCTARGELRALGERAPLPEGPARVAWRGKPRGKASGTTPAKRKGPRA